MTDGVYHHIEMGGGLTNPSTPKKTPPSKTGRCGQDAQGHATVWIYRRVRQPLAIPCSCLKEEQGPTLLHRLQETKRCHEEGLFPTAPD
jgi:hypothetical protein